MFRKLIVAGLILILSGCGHAAVTPPLQTAVPPVAKTAPSPLSPMANPQTQYGTLDKLQTEQLCRYIQQKYGGLTAGTFQTSWYASVRECGVYLDEKGQKTAVLTLGVVDSSRLANINSSVLFSPFSIARVALEDAAGKSISVTNKPAI